MLKLTYAELLKITYDDLDGFTVLYNDIPKDGHSSDYIEDDGRQRRNCEFEKDKVCYQFNYTWYPNHSHEFPLDLGNEPSGIEFVDISVIDIPVVVEEPIVILTDEQIADKKLWDSYYEIESEVSVMDKHKAKTIPVGVIDDIIDFLDTYKFNLYELRANIIPTCIEYRIEHKSFWRYLQQRRGLWLKPKN